MQCQVFLCMAQVSLGQSWDMSLTWSQTKADFGARTVAEMAKCASGKGQRFGSIAHPLFEMVTIPNVIPNVLHLFICISDQLVNHVISELLRRDNIAKNTKQICKQKFSNIVMFEKLVQGLPTEWRFYVDKGSGIIESRDFTGPEHIKIQKATQLDEIIPRHQKLSDIKLLWANFTKLGCIERAE